MSGVSELPSVDGASLALEEEQPATAASTAARPAASTVARAALRRGMRMVMVLLDVKGTGCKGRCHIAPDRVRCCKPFCTMLGLDVTGRLFLIGFAM
ncbi:hypothetical protein GCM10010988_17650 [Cnuibacter physcomitrellae]|nr:hypothetical protein GCM10010988_17650 [Cnuibacter physcomitrellae]